MCVDGTSSLVRVRIDLLCPRGSACACVYVSPRPFHLRRNWDGREEGRENRGERERDVKESSGVGDSFQVSPTLCSKKKGMTDVSRTQHYTCLRCEWLLSRGTRVNRDSVRGRGRSSLLALNNDLYWFDLRQVVDLNLTLLVFSSRRRQLILYLYIGWKCNFESTRPKSLCRARPIKTRPKDLSSNYGPINLRLWRPTLKLVGGLGSQFPLATGVKVSAKCCYHYYCLGVYRMRSIIGILLPWRWRR